jgi:hypothetical protein
MSDRSLHNKPGLLACQGISEKRLFVRLMSLSQTSWKVSPEVISPRDCSPEPQQENPIKSAPIHGMFLGRAHTLGLERPFCSLEHVAGSLHVAPNMGNIKT